METTTTHKTQTTRNLAARFRCYLEGQGNLIAQVAEMIDSATAELDNLIAAMEQAIKEEAATKAQTSRQTAPEAHRCHCRHCWPDDDHECHDPWCYDDGGERLHGETGNPEWSA